MNLHFSVDDVGRSFRWLAYNQPASIFDMRLFGKLREWNSKFRLLATLYCFIEVDDFRLKDLPQKYGAELAENSGWLKLGFHGARGDYPFIEEHEYAKGFEAFEQAIERLHFGATDILRLHSWHVSSEQAEYFKRNGIKVLLCTSDSSGVFTGLECWRTNVWFEKLPEITPASLCIGEDRVVAFTHEQCFEQQQRRIEDALELYCEAGYRFLA